MTNKGCHNQMFYLVVLIRVISTALAFGVATHLFTIMPRGRSWCSACSTRHVTFDGIFFVCPSTVMTEFPGMQVGFFFDPTVTWPKCLVLLPKLCLFGGCIHSDSRDTVLEDTPNTLLSCVPEWW